MSPSRTTATTPRRSASSPPAPPARPLITTRRIDDKTRSLPRHKLRSSNLHRHSHGPTGLSVSGPVCRQQQAVRRRPSVSQPGGNQLQRGLRRRLPSRTMLPMDYHGTTLHACDVALIDAPSWLNDNVIGFVYEWYAHEKYAKERDLEFVNPAVVFIIMHEDDDECLAPLIESVDLARRSLVFMPINNNVNVTAAGGGSHWSLLVLDRIAQQYVHFDSMRGSNMQYARQVAKQIGKCSPELASWTMSVGDCPQQDNANDCGVFVLEMTQQASDWFKDHRSLNGFKAAVKPGMIGARRRAVKELVREIERRSSG